MSAWEAFVVGVVLAGSACAFTLIATIAYLDRADRDLLAEADEAVRLGNAGAES